MADFNSGIEYLVSSIFNEKLQDTINKIKEAKSVLNDPSIGSGLHSGLKQSISYLETLKRNLEEVISLETKRYSENIQFQNLAEQAYARQRRGEKLLYTAGSELGKVGVMYESQSRILSLPAPSPEDYLKQVTEPLLDFESGRFKDPKTGRPIDTSYAEQTLKDMKTAREKIENQYEQAEEEFRKAADAEEQFIKNAEKIRQEKDKNKPKPKQEQRIYSQQDLIGMFGQAQTPLGLRSNEAYKNVINLAKKYGFYGDAGEPLKKLTKVTQEEPAGVFNLLFRDVDKSTGVFRNLSLVVDKYGDVMTRTKRNLLSFTDSIGKNTVEFLKWSTAVTLVLGSFRLFQDAVRTAIENESKLADVIIALNSAQRSMNEIFSDANKIAQSTGEEVSGVIDAFSLAYRATGGAKDSTERYNVATKLLSDSLVLSKLSILDQAEAIDVLSAALRQSFSGDGSLERGTELLDKWVRTTKVANVDLATLATSFAIVGDASESAGLNVDELNGLIAAVAETGIASGREAGNTVRAIVSGFQSDKARTELQKLGIAVEDSSGKMRSFEEIMSQVATLRQVGAIDDTAFNKLTLALGGGVRRQAVWVTLIDNWQRVSEVTKESAQASGDAADAMGTKLDTVQTASVRLGNSFEKLANTLGTKGGVLDGFREFLKLAGTLVTVLDTLLDIVGRAGPALAVTLAATGILGFKGQGFKQAKLDDLSNAISKIPILGGLISGNVDQRRAGTMRAISGATLLGPVIGNLLDKETTGQEKLYKVGANIAGGLIGVLTGSPIGTILGASIADAFVSNVLLYKPSFENLANDIILDTRKKAPPLETDAEKAARIQKDIATEIIYKGGGNTSAVIGSFISSLFAMSGNVMLDIFGDRGIQKRFGNITPEQYASFVASTPKPGFAPLNALISAINGEGYSTEIQDLITRGESLKQGTLGFAGDWSQGQVSNILESNKVLLDSLRKQQETSLRGRLVEREITPSVYGRGLEQLAGFDLLASQFMFAFGQELEQPAEKTFSEIAKISTEATTEELNYLISLSSDIASARNQLNTAKVGTDEYKQALERINALLPLTTGYFEELSSAIEGRFKITDVVDLTDLLPTVSGKSILDIITPLAQANYKEFEKGQATAGISQEQLDSFLKNQENFLLQTTKDSFKYVSPYQIGARQEDVQKAIQEAQGLGLFTSAEKGIGFQTYDVTEQRFKNIVEGDLYKGMAEKLSDLGYKLDEQTFIAITSEGNMNKFFNKDTKIIQYLLSEILDTEKKQLERGLYNFPSGMFPLVPFTGYERGFTDSESILESVKKQPQVSSAGGLTSKIREGARNPLDFFTDEGINRLAQQSLESELLAKKAQEKGKVPSWADFKKMEYATVPRETFTAGTPHNTNITLRNQLDVRLLLDGKILAQMVIQKITETLKRADNIKGSLFSNQVR